jgi:cyclase
VLKVRVIPCLTLADGGLVKTVEFTNPNYIGDPINAVKIFNDKFVDEIVFLDIEASALKREPDFKLIQEIASECFIPFCYGGGIHSVDVARKILSNGVEKVLVNSAALDNAGLITDLAQEFGSQSVVAAMDVRRGWMGGYSVMKNRGRVKSSWHPISHARRLEASGAGEILMNSVNQDGAMTGFDLDILKQIVDAVSIPVIACGGAGNLQHFQDAVRHCQVSGVAAGSLFVYKGKRRGILINYPNRNELKRVLG